MTSLDRLNDTYSTPTIESIYEWITAGGANADDVVSEWLAEMTDEELIEDLLGSGWQLPDEEAALEAMSAVRALF